MMLEPGRSRKYHFTTAKPDFASRSTGFKSSVRWEGDNERLYAMDFREKISVSSNRGLMLLLIMVSYNVVITCV